MESKIRIGTVQTQGERAAIYRLRYETYVEELGWPNRYANHGRRELTDRWDASGNLFGAFLDGEAVATVRTNYGSGTDLSVYVAHFGIGDYDPNTVAVASFLMVAPEHRRSRLALEMAWAALEHGLDHGVRWTFIECEPEMVDFYRRLGFELFRKRVVHPDYGPAVCMRLDPSHFPIRRRVCAVAA